MPDLPRAHDITLPKRREIHVFQKVASNVRPAYTWQCRGLAVHDKAREWAQSIRATLRALAAVPVAGGRHRLPHRVRQHRRGLGAA